MHVHRKKSFQCDVCKMFFTFLTGLNKHKKLGRCKGPPDENFKAKLCKEEIAKIARDQLIEITVNPKKTENFNINVSFDDFEAEKSLEPKESKRVLPTRKNPSPKKLPTIEDLPIREKPAVVIRNLTMAEIENQKAGILTSSSGRIIKKKQPVYITALRPSKVTKKTQSYTCDCCDLKFNTKAELAEHIDSEKKIVQVDKYKCIPCELNFTTPFELKKHLAIAHQKKKNFECDQCEKKYISNHLLQMHKKSHENLKEYKCGSENCSFETNSPYDLNNHIKRMHNPVRPFICTICKRAFKRRCDLKNHIETVHSEVKTYVKCEVCEAIVLERGLASHMINRHSEKAKYKPFVCTICGKAERYEKNLQRHYDAVHEPKDRGVIYQCIECHEQFNRRRELTAHSFVHFEGIVYQCNTCGNKYKSRKELTNHEYTHRPIEYPCPLCKQLFQTKSGRGKHLKRHTMAGEDTSNLILPKKLKEGQAENATVIAIIPEDAIIEEELYEGYEVLEEEVDYINIV